MHAAYLACQDPTNLPEQWVGEQTQNAVAVALDHDYQERTVALEDADLADRCGLACSSVDDQRVAGTCACFLEGQIVLVCIPSAAEVAAFVDNHRTAVEVESVRQAHQRQTHSSCLPDHVSHP